MALWAVRLPHLWVLLSLSLTRPLRTILALSFPLASFEGQISPGSWVTPKLSCGPCSWEGKFRAAAVCFASPTGLLCRLWNFAVGDVSSRFYTIMKMGRLESLDRHLSFTIILDFKIKKRKKLGVSKSFS